MKCFFVDIKKNLISFGFLSATFMVFALCFMNEIGTKEEPATVLQALFLWDEKRKLSDFSYSSYMIFAKGLSSFVTLFVPLIVAFPLMDTYCNERKSGLIRFTMSRVGWGRYMVSKYVASLITGGIACMLGYLLYYVILMISFPTLSHYEIDQDYLDIVLNNGLTNNIIMLLLSSFVFGAVSTILPLILSSIFRNQYVITCFPVVIIYIIRIIIDKIETHYSKLGHFEIYDYYEPFRPDSILSLVNCDNTSVVYYRIIEVNMFCVFFGLVLFLLIMKIHKDRGW